MSTCLVKAAGFPDPGAVINLARQAPALCSTPCCRRVHLASIIMDESGSCTASKRTKEAATFGLLSAPLPLHLLCLLLAWQALQCCQSGGYAVTRLPRRPRDTAADRQPAVHGSVGANAAERAPPPAGLLLKALWGCSPLQSLTAPPQRTHAFPCLQVSRELRTILPKNFVLRLSDRCSQVPSSV